MSKFNYNKYFFRCNEVVADRATLSFGQPKKERKNNVLMVSCSEIEMLVKAISSKNCISFPMGINNFYSIYYKKFYKLCSYPIHFYTIFLRGNDSSSFAMTTRDCVNGTWFERGHFEESTTYSELVTEFAKAREIEENRENAISFEADLMIYNRTK